MKKLLFILFFLYSLIAGAQQYNNEWIDYNKTYYKFKVGATGLYRIPQSAVANISGLANADVSQFQLWRNGVEVPVYTSNQTGTLATGGYIEFWGEANDGKADNALYRNSGDQINNSKSLFTDTASYFLTINTSGSTKRLTPTSNTIPTGVAPEPYFMDTVGIYPNETIYLGRYQPPISEAVYTASYEGGKGWTSNDIEKGQTRNFQVTSLFPYTGGGAPAMQVNFNVVGNAPGLSRTAQLRLNNNQIFSTSLLNFDFAKLSATVPVTALTGTTENFNVINTATTDNNRIRVASILLTYPRVFNFGNSGNFRFQLPASASGKYLEISGFSYTGTPVLYDLSNGRRYEVDISNPSIIKVLVQPGAAYDLLLVNETATNIKTVASFDVRNFVNYSTPENQGNYLIITHNAMLNGSNGIKPVEEYRSYRTSAAGGGYNAKVYMIDQLVDQFSFGIKYDPLAVRNFIRLARNKFSSPPKSVFIIGKGVKYTSARYNESSPTTERLNLVPTFGDPSSDVLLAAEGASSIPLTPIGRVSAINGDELKTYLEKVKQYETGLTPDADIDASLWKKNVVHIVGASDQATINTLTSFLSQGERVLTDTLFGVNVSNFLTGASAAEQQASAERLRQLFNNGIGLLTYFGHSAANSLSFNLDDPNSYSNYGKYPVFNMLGCNVGDIFILSDDRLNSYNTISEKYLFSKDRGSIGMMAGTSFGYPYQLNNWLNQFYRLLAATGYATNLGELMQHAVSKTYQYAGGEDVDFIQRTQSEEFVLNGDPAIKFYQFDKPDYAIDDDGVSVEPGIISVADANYTLKAKIANLGKAINTNLIVELKRTYPDLSVKTVRRDTIQGIHYMDSLTYKFDVDPIVDKGANKFTITIDPDNKIDELFKTNNSITKDVFIYEDDIKPVYPYDYSVINKQNITFAASTGDPLAPQRNYMIEVDTVRSFNSQLKAAQTKGSPGGVIEFNPSINFRDSTVYYWRVAKVPTSTDQPIWSNASFTYLSMGESGFGQFQTGQFDYTLDLNISLDSKARLFHYDSITAAVSVNNVITTSPGSFLDVASQVNGQINGNGVQSGYLRDDAGGISPQENSLRFYLIDNKTLTYVYNVDLGTTGMYGSYRPIPYGTLSQRYATYFQFDISTTQSRKKVMSFLDSIPKGYFVAMTSNQIGTTVLPSVWQSDTTVLGQNISLYHKLKSLGFDSLDMVRTVVPYIFVYQNGNPKPFTQAVGTSPTEKLRVIANVPAALTTGKLASPVFSKSSGWKKIDWDGFSIENPSTDVASISIAGVDKNGIETILVNDVPVSQKSADLSAINTSGYTGLKLYLQSTDETNRSPYQLKYWNVSGTPVPEGAIAPNIYWQGKDTLEIGEPLNVGVAFKNVSDKNFDSVKVKMTIRDRNNKETVFNIPKQKALPVNDTIKLQVPVNNTTTYVGANQLYVEFNPDGNQPEQYQFNNFLSKNFYVKGDSLNPYIDVTFDGVHILNRDIISSKPNILIKLTDDAKYLLLNSTDLVKVQLKYPDGMTRDYKFNTDTLTFTPPGSGGNDANTATINFNPVLLDDGSYELVISGKDQSGNTAGNLAYNISFQVINKPMISNLLNYPNPFTTSTTFVFTLTGSEIPQNIRIQILTITGKIVKEITKADLGSIRIGRNITEYKWDGTDQYGQKLANGVYLYRVLTNLNGKSLDKYSTKDNDTDKYFNKGYGKMVLIR